MRVELSYFEECPHWRDAKAHLLTLQSELGFELAYRVIDSPETAATVEFHGSPSITVNGDDPFASPNQPVGFTCRRYDAPDGPAGSPTIDQLRAALTAVSGPPTGEGRT